jgi:hypothetical protein
VLAWVGRLGLPAYLIFLVYRALHGGPPVPSSVPSAVPAGAVAALIPVREWIVRAGLEIARLGPLGLLAALAMPRRPGFVARSLGMAFPAALLSLVAAAVVGSVDAGPPWALPGLLEMVGPGFAVLFGVWVGMTLTRGLGATLFFLPRLALYGVLLFGGAGVLAWRCFEPRPLGFEPTPVTLADKHRLYGLLRDKSPMQLREGQTAELLLSPHDVDLMMAWGLSVGDPDRKSHFDVDSRTATVAASWRLPRFDRYLNVVARGRAEVHDGVISLQGDALKLGSFAAPGWAVPPVAFLVQVALNGDRRLRPVLNAVHLLAMEKGGLHLVYGRTRLPAGFLTDIFRGSAPDADLSALGPHPSHLREDAARQQPPGETPLGASIQ